MNLLTINTQPNLDQKVLFKNSNIIIVDFYFDITKYIIQFKILTNYLNNI